MKIGFLPLYIKLYDDVVPDIRPRMEAFYEKIAGLLEARGFTVVRAPFCRLESEFRSAVHTFENAGAEAILTLHMAYSPSLESIGALTNYLNEHAPIHYEVTQITAARSRKLGDYHMMTGLNPVVVAAFDDDERRNEKGELIW